MIRLPPSTIVLGRADVKDFEKRRRREDAAGTKTGITGTQPFTDQPSIRVRDRSQLGSVSQLAEADSHTPATSSTAALKQLRQSPPRFRDGEANESQPTVDATSGEKEMTLARSVTSPENLRSASSSPPADDFRFEGFVECPTTPSMDDSPPTVNDERWTSASITLPSAEVQRLRTRPPLPRSPLFIAQNLSISPDRRPTTGLTPRVVSRVANQNTPGIIFSHPARRPPRQTAPNYRHQPNSFSFDSGERASAVYEQERIASVSTTEGAARPANDLNLHEELGAISLSGSDDESGSSFLSDYSDEADHQQMLPDLESNESPRVPRNSLLASPQLPLPPPFSAASRNSSRSDVLPSGQPKTVAHPPTSPVRETSRSPVGRSAVSPSSVHSDSILMYSPPWVDRSTATRNTRSFLQRATQAISPHRSRSVSAQTTSHGSFFGSPAMNPLPSAARSASPAENPRTPSWNRIYNDALPPHTQPQTPAHLPERRHQSRFHPSLTAPMIRALSSFEPTSAADSDGLPSGRSRIPFATPSRRLERRGNSPIGLRSRGFEGLYGGRENGDEEQNWADGVRSNNASMRLWGLRDSRNDSRSMRETPEPEDWRGRRHE